MKNICIANLFFCASASLCLSIFLLHLFACFSFSFLSSQSLCCASLSFTLSHPAKLSLSFSTMCLVFLSLSQSVFLLCSSFLSVPFLPLFLLPPSPSQYLFLLTDILVYIYSWYINEQYKAFFPPSFLSHLQGVKPLLVLKI
jgi:hypothetical protein